VTAIVDCTKDVDDTNLSDSVVAPPAAALVDVVWLPLEVEVGVLPLELIRDAETAVVTGVDEALLTPELIAD